MLGEYTWRQNDAHYLRFELGLEWKMLNFAIRPLFYIKDNNTKEIYKEKRDSFCFEYSFYLKFSPVYFGFQRFYGRQILYRIESFIFKKFIIKII